MSTYFIKVDNSSTKYLRYLFIFLCLSFVTILDLSAQKRVFFKEKTVYELGLNFPTIMIGWVSEVDVVFPEIWEDSNFDYAGGSIFSGYYTVANTNSSENIPEGEIKLIRTTQFDVGGIKEILVFNIKNDRTNGKIQYSKFSTESDNLETEPFEKPSTWELESSISAIAGESGYVNIKYRENLTDENGVKYTIIIEQKSGPSISLSYFKALVNWNKLKPEEKPVIKKFKR